MAIITMRGPADALLDSTVGSSAQIVRTGADFVDIQLDDAAADDIVEALDEYMDRRGWSLAAADIQDPQSEIILVSPDGTRWALRVDDAGALSTTLI